MHPMIRLPRRRSAVAPTRALARRQHHLRPLLEQCEDRTLLTVATHVDLAVSNATLAPGQNETITIGVQSGNTPASGGVVTLYDNGQRYTQIGLPSTGIITAYDNLLSVGPHNFTASYSGYGNFAASTSNVEQSSATSVISVAGLSNPAGLSDPDGVAVDRSGNLYIADYNNNRVVEVPANGSQATYFTGINNPAGLAVDSSGNLYVSDSRDNSVYKITTSTSGFLTIHNQYPYNTNGLNGAGGVALDSSGNLYVTDAGNNRVVKLTGDPAVGRTSQSTFLANLHGPQGVAVDAAGNVYIADTNNGQVLKVTNGQASQAVINLSGPNGVALDAVGNIYTTDTNNSQVIEVTTGKTQVTLPLKTADGTALRFPQAVTVDAAGNVYIADSGNDRVIKVTPGVPVTVTPLPATSIAVSASAATLYSGLAETLTATVTSIGATPSGGVVTFLDNGTAIGTANLSNGTASLTTTSLALGSHNFTAQFGGTTSFAASTSSSEPTSATIDFALQSTPGLNGPDGVAVDGAGNLYVADVNNNRVVEFFGDQSGATQYVGLSSPAAVAVTSSGLYIADTGSGRVVEFAADGSQPIIATGLNNPQGVAVDANGTVYIADTGNNQILKVVGGVRSVYATGLGNPEALALDAYGNLYVANNYAGQIVEIKVGGGQTIVASGLSAPEGVAVDKSGNIYIADTGNNQVVEVKAGGGKLTIATGLNKPRGVTVDNNGNVAITDTRNNQIAEVLAGVPVTVVPIGTPTANNQAVAVGFNTAQAITLTGTDPDSPALPLTFKASQPSHGTISGTGANVTYSPYAGFHGTDSFSFTVSNGTNTTTGTITLTVAVGTPVAPVQVVYGNANTRPFTLAGYDPENPALPLTYQIITPPFHGTLTGTAPNLVYTPNPGTSGPDFFQYSLSNGTNSVSTSVSLTGTIGTPIANYQFVSLRYNTTKAITLVATDPDSPPLPLTYTITAGPSHGRLTGTAPNFTYIPNRNYLGTDSFTYSVSNGTNRSTPATVNLSVLLFAPSAPAGGSVSLGAPGEGSPTGGTATEGGDTGASGSTGDTGADGSTDDTTDVPAGTTAFPIAVTLPQPSASVIAAGATYTATASFSDDAAGPYSVLVDYGDGTTPTALSLDAPGSIPLTHAYARAGTYVITMGVTDLTGGVGLQVTTVNVGPTPQPASGLGAGRDAFVRTLYQDLLGRGPTPAELTQGAQRLRAPASYPLAVLSLVAGREYRRLQRTHQGTGLSVLAAYHAAIAARNQAEPAPAVVKHLAAKVAQVRHSHR